MNFCQATVVFKSGMVLHYIFNQSVSVLDFIKETQKVGPMFKLTFGEDVSIAVAAKLLNDQKAILVGEEK